jgi:hypothetical protein
VKIRRGRSKRGGEILATAFLEASTSFGKDIKCPYLKAVRCDRRARGLSSRGKMCYDNESVHNSLGDIDAFSDAVLCPSSLDCGD